MKRIPFDMKRYEQNQYISQTMDIVKNMVDTWKSTMIFAYMRFMMEQSIGLDMLHH
jgi:hypothetical protein